MNAIVETGRCICGVVVFNGSLCSRLYDSYFIVWVVMSLNKIVPIAQ